MSGKLVRDGVPELIRRGGTVAEVEVLVDDHKYEVALRAKLTEEASEVIQAPDRGALAAELDDLLDVIDELARFHGLSNADILVKRVSKKRRRGGFEKRYFLKNLQ